MHDYGIVNGITPGNRIPSRSTNEERSCIRCERPLSRYNFNTNPLCSPCYEALPDRLRHMALAKLRGGTSLEKVGQDLQRPGWAARAAKLPLGARNGAP